MKAKRNEVKKNNKGFSLVELIIVIAIMAILVGVLAPSLLRYVERARVSADTQLADSVKTAFTTALLDPEINNGTNSIPSGDIVLATDGSVTITTIASDDKFYTEVASILGYDSIEAMQNATTGIAGKLQSKNVTTIYVTVSTSYSVTVTLDDGDTSTEEYITVD